MVTVMVQQLEEKDYMMSVPKESRKTVRGRIYDGDNYLGKYYFQNDFRDGKNPTNLFTTNNRKRYQCYIIETPGLDNVIEESHQT